jgi:hypothetical protein
LTFYLSITYLLVFGGLLFLAALVLTRTRSRTFRYFLLLLGLLTLALPLLLGFFQINFYFALLVVPILLVLSVLLIGNAFRTRDQASGKIVQEGQSPSFTSPIVSGAFLVLGLLLLLVTLYRLYWFLIWDSTDDSIGLLLFFPLLAVAVACGFWLTFALPRKSRTARLVFLFAFPLLVFSTYALASQVDYRQLTQQRLERIGQAVEAYYSNQGRYPQNLRQLVPRYLLRIPEPVFIYGQDWCYRPAEGGFQLAYLTRDHWSSPYLSARSYHPDGDPVELERLCEDQIAAHQQRQSWTYWQPGD